MKLRASLLLSVAAVGPFSAPAFAQTVPEQQPSAQGGGADALVGDIIVTAQKRSERLSEVPLSITAATGAELTKAGVVEPSDLGKIVPGFTYQSSTIGPPVYSIRGVGFYDTAIAASPAVSVYTDQVPFPYLVMAAGATLDLERVEVLKGPQGTLFGQNATGGAINFIAAKPTKDLHYGGSFELARFDRVSADGFVSGPLSSTLGARFAFRTEQGGAYQKSLSRPDDRLGDKQFTTGRLTLDWEPSSSAHFILSANGWVDKSDTVAPQFIRYRAASNRYTTLAAELSATPTAPRNNRAADWDAGLHPSRDAHFYQTSLRGEFELSPSVSLVTISAYSHLKYDTTIDGDGTQFNNFVARTAADIDAFSQEGRLQGDLGDGALRWVIGANYAYDDAKDTRTNVVNSSNNGVGPFRYNAFNIINNIKSESVGIFGSLDYQLTRTISVNGSARYTDQSRKGESCFADFGDGRLAAAFSQISITPLVPGGCATFRSPAPPGFPPFVPLNDFATNDLKEDNISWRGNVSWKPNSDVHIYANVTRGYKAGSFASLPLIFDRQYQPVSQESVTAYEAGFKLSLLDRLLQVSGAGFYYDYKDKQILGSVVTLFGALPTLVSVPKSRIKGAEVNFTLRPATGLTLNGGVTWLDTKVRGSYVTVDPFGANIDVDGYRFPNTPKWQITADAEYQFPLTATVDGFVGGNVNYRKATPAAFGGGAEFVLPSYALVDLRAGIDIDNGRFRGEVFGRNVFNKFYLSNVGYFLDSVTRIAGTPAVYGVRLSAAF